MPHFIYHHHHCHQEYKNIVSIGIYTIHEEVFSGMISPAPYLFIISHGNIKIVLSLFDFHPLSQEQLGCKSRTNCTLLQ